MLLWRIPAKRVRDLVMKSSCVFPCPSNYSEHGGERCGSWWRMKAQAGPASGIRSVSGFWGACVKKMMWALGCNGLAAEALLNEASS
ncbi:unnamed protein product [Victoria cruziana]